MQELKTLVAAFTLICTSAANADLIITLANDGSGGVLASFVGSGEIIAGDTGSTSSQSIISRFTCEPPQDCDPFTEIESAYFDLATPLEIASGISLVNIGIDDDGSNSCSFDSADPCLLDTDDLFLNFNTFVSIGTTFDFVGESLIPGLNFSVLNPGTYSPLLLRSTTFGNTTLVISSVPEPGALALFAIGLAGMGLVRRKRKPI